MIYSSVRADATVTSYLISRVHSPKDGVREQIACDDLYPSGNTKTESHIRGKGMLCNALTTIVSSVLLMWFRGLMKKYLDGGALCSQ